MFSPVQYPIDPLYYFEHQLTWCNAITKIRLILAGFGPGRIHSVISVSILTGHSSFQNAKILITVWDAIDPLYYFDHQLTWCNAIRKIQLILAGFGPGWIHSVITVSILTGHSSFKNVTILITVWDAIDPFHYFEQQLTWCDANTKIQLIPAWFSNREVHSVISVSILTGPFQFSEYDDA